MSILQKKTIKLNDIEVIRLEDCQEHFDLFKEIFLDPEIMNTTMSFDGEPAPNDNESLKELFNEWIECNYFFDSTMSVIVKKNNNFCGLLLVRMYSKIDTQYIVEVGHFYKQEYQGKGIAILIANFISDNCFQSLPLYSSVCKIRMDNLLSQAVVVKNGFTLKNITKKNDIYICLYEKISTSKSIKIDHIKNLGYINMKEYIEESIVIQMQHLSN